MNLAQAVSTATTVNMSLRRHTRSQPMSPGGFVSLETVEPTRRRRVTRSTSQAQTPTETPTETPVEPPSRPATRSTSKFVPKSTATSKSAPKQTTQRTIQSKKTTKKTTKAKTAAKKTTEKTESTEAEVTETADSESPELFSFESGVGEVSGEVESKVDNAKVDQEPTKLSESAEATDAGPSTSEKNESELNNPYLDPKGQFSEETQDHGPFISPPASSP